MILALFISCCAAYTISAALYMASLTRGGDGSARKAQLCLAGSILLHIGFLGADYSLKSNLPAADIRGTLSVLTLVTLIAFLVVSLIKPRVAVLGAFITPITLLFFLGSGLGKSVGHVPAGVRSFLLPVHITVNTLGIVAFAFAFAFAVGYVLQERALRRKQFGGVFERLPALDVLDSLGFRATVAGFPLLTIGIVTGAIWATRLNVGLITVSQAFGLVAWILFAAVLFLRGAAGWRGRKAAIGTILGFVCALLVLVGYLLRSGTAT